MLTAASTNRFVGDLAIFDEPAGAPGDEALVATWEAEYARVMDQKYAKGTRGFSTALLRGEPERSFGADPPLYVVPRERGGPSYKSVPLVDRHGARVASEHVAYVQVSKGFGGQDASSFTLGPVIGEGLCVVNAAFSKQVCACHVEGGGRVDLKRKGFWRPPSRSEREREVVRVSNEAMLVDGELVDTHAWLAEHEELWLDEWERWRRSVALCSVGSFGWGDCLEPLAYRASSGEYLGFVEWKLRCYVAPAYELLPQTRPYAYIVQLRAKGWAVGLVHPMGVSGDAERPLTRDSVRALYDDPREHACMPYVLAGLLLGEPLRR
jgi:hypothetical protein